RYLCALMASLPDNRGVLELAKNLFEELGLAPGSRTPHYVIYADMLKAFGLTTAGAHVAQETQQLIDTMFHYCRQTDPAYGMGALCLGAEALVPAMYSDILTAFEAHGVDRDRVEFFHIHIGCDDDHAETIAKLMLEQIDRDPMSLQRIIQAGNALVSARESFFNGVTALMRKAFLTLSVS
ncbi:iron-containing redox enzyme family protein, partial [Paraburkholderia aspalathi]|uniref:iron-containing redox enzyme family protein n=1 Tax=Paraburkholderia aspalathi TaxID=1324617 RepID=UPI0038B92863